MLPPMAYESLVERQEMGKERVDKEWLKQKGESGEVAQQVKVPASKPDDLSSIPRR